MATRQVFDEEPFDPAIFDCNSDGLNDLDRRYRTRDWRRVKPPARIVYDRVR